MTITEAIKKCVENPDIDLMTMKVSHPCHVCQELKDCFLESYSVNVVTEDYNSIHYRVYCPGHGSSFPESLLMSNRALWGENKMVEGLKKTKAVEATELVPEVNITVVPTPRGGKAEATDTKKWFEEMIDECKDIITESVFQSRWLLVEGYWLLGNRILQERDNWAREETYGKKIVQRVARSLSVSPRTVYYAMQCAKKFPSLEKIPDGKNISWRKLIQDHLPDPATREEADDNLEANLNASLIEFLLEDKGKGVPVKLYRDDYGEIRVKKIIKGKEYRSVPIKDDIKKESTEKKVAKIPAGYTVEDSVEYEEEVEPG